MNEIDILARTIYGEARGEYGRLNGGIASLIAVGNVVINRLKQPRAFGHTISEICIKPFQFSCWNTQDPNRALLLEIEIKDPLFRVCRHVACKVIQYEWPDLTNGSNHYHAVTLTPLPAWAREQKPKMRIANHLFYQL